MVGDFEVWVPIVMRSLSRSEIMSSQPVFRRSPQRRVSLVVFLNDQHAAYPVKMTNR
jgi:hypothetical protein